MTESLLQVGKTIYSWPQLGDAATLSGVAIAYALRRIALKQPLTQQKVEISLDSIFDPTYADGKTERDARRAEFRRAIGLP